MNTSTPVTPLRAGAASPARRRQRARVLVTATGLTAAVALSGCSLIPGLQAPAKPADAPAKAVSVKIQPLFVQGESGGVGTETINRKPSDDGSFRIDFSEDEVSGLGDASRAASWNAAIVSTLLTGQPLSGRFSFEIQGKIDGPSAGALKTVGLIAAANGDQIDKTKTMTGTINATGTIGPVGGIPEKIKGAADAGIKTVLIPLGQRNTPNAKGQMVDVIREGDKLGVEVIEAGDVYEAYGELTGEKLEKPRREDDPRLDKKSYDKLDAQVTAAYGRYESAKQQYAGVPKPIAKAMKSTGLPDQIKLSYTQAKDLQRQGMVAGAFVKAQEAAALMETLHAAASMMNPILTQGFEGIGTVLDQTTNTEPTKAKFMAFLDSLGTFEPQTLSDVEALVTAYSGSFDAYTLVDFADGELAAIQKKFENGSYSSIDAVLGDLMVPLMYQKLAEAQVENTKAVFEVGRNLPGAKFDTKIDLQQVGDFFRRGAEANYAAFTSSGTVSQLAESNGVSTDVVIGYLANYDTNISLAAHQQAVLPALEDYIGEGKPNAAYAVMGYGLNNYVRNQMLVEKYYNNAVLDENYQLVGLNFAGALDNAIDLSRDQAASEIAALRGHEVEPALSIAIYEAAPSNADGGPEGEFSQLSDYSSGYVTSRLLSYLGAWKK